MEVKSYYFEKSGEANTAKTLEAAYRRARELGISQIVVASTYGETARQALELFKNSGIKVVVVTISLGFQEEGWVMEGKVRQELEEKGACILTTLHALGDDVSSAFTTKFGGHAPNEIVADTLRIFSQGMKVCVEIVLMAADAGAIDVNRDVIAIAGTERGADTAVVIKPAHPRKFLDLRVREVLAKPRV